MKFVFLLAIGFLSSLARAEVHQASRMQEVLSYLDQTPPERTWIVFDLDNTVIAPAQTLGSDQWFDYMVEKLGRVDAAIDAWSQVQRKTRVKPVESYTPELIRSLQSSGFRVFALTARPDSLAETTRSQLQSIGVSFGKVIAIGPGQSKGAALVSEVRASGAPGMIVFVDDKEKHARSVDEALSALPVAHHELRYGAADPEVKAFSPRIAEVEWSVFQASGVLVSDREAEERLRGGR